MTFQESPSSLSAPMPGSGVGTESLLTGFIDWTKEQPTWQQSTLRRLLLQGVLDPSDLEEAKMYCEAESSGDSERLAEATLLAIQDLPSDAPSQKPVRLKAIESVQNVNALKNGETLSFGEKGLTVVYGPNGSGKSGYSRILKRACRARAPGRTVLGNAFSNGIEKPRRARLRFLVGDENLSKEWEDQESPLEELSSVNVYDSECGQVFIDQENDLAYRPSILVALNELAKVCDKMKADFDAEIAAIDSRKPIALLSPPVAVDGDVAKFLKEMQGANAQSELTRLVRLAPSGSSQPVAQRTSRFQTAADLAAYREKAEAIRNDLVAVAKLLPPSRAQEIKRLREEIDSLEKAALVAAEGIRSTSLLEGVGSPEWLTLWNAARAFAQSKAYPEKVFPRESTKCVLCQQDLSEGAAERLATFDSFVSKHVSSSLEASRKKLAVEMEQLKLLLTRSVAWNKLSRLLKAKESEVAVLAARKRLAKLLRTCREILRGQNVAVDVSANVAEELDGDLARVDGEIRLLRSGAASTPPSVRAFSAEESDSLWLRTNAAEIRAWIEQLARRRQVEESIRLCRTNAITIKSSAIAEAVATKQLAAAFQSELRELEETADSLTLAKAGKKGVPYFKLKFSNSGAAVGHVLSDGERRVAALAVFFAELAVSGNSSAIVLDDPVSSLDLERREQVARRLVKASQTRQVIVFTHDLVFLWHLLEESGKQKSPLTCRSLARTKTEAGIVSSEVPPKARTAGDLALGAKKQVANTKVHFENGRTIEWEEAAISVATKMRDAWERAVEVVAGQVVRRFSQKIDPKKLLLLTTLTSNDHDIVQAGYGYWSQLLHTESLETKKPVPEPDRLLAEIEKMEKWLTDVLERQNKLTKSGQAIGTVKS